jgi:hypothetical protein
VENFVTVRLAESPLALVQPAIGCARPDSPILQIEKKAHRLTINQREAMRLAPN